MKKINLKFKKKSNNPSKPKKNVKNGVLSIVLIVGISIVSLILIFALYIILSSPEFDKEKLYPKQSSVLYYNDGETELTRIGSQNRVTKDFEQLPQVLVDAIIATEDSRFFQHNGFDAARFLKASFGQLTGKRNAGGASTITMQVVKKTYTSSEARGIQGIIRKFTDIYMSVFKVENNYTKEEIIAFYVNSMWFGHDGNINYNGIAGVEQACQYYFGKSVSDITLAEASIIAGMFNNPAYYSPYRYPERTRNRQATVLSLMVNHGYITEAEKEAVLAIPLESLLVEKKTASSDNQAVIEYIINDVKNKTGYDPTYTPMKIVTTIKKDVQDVLNKLENEELSYKFPDEYLQESIVVTSTEDGSIIGLTGGRNYGAKGNNRAVARRQPGSTAKIIFDYGPYIEHLNGAPSTLFLDEETTYSNGQPIRNSNRKYEGLMTMRTALVNSRNIPALRAFKAVYAENPEYISSFAHSLGINYGSELYESASIGGFEGISPVQMSAAYATFGRGGSYIEPYSFTKATIIETGKEYEHKYEEKQVMSEETAYLITHMLIGNSVGNVKKNNTDIAAKGGTSNVGKKEATAAGITTSATRDSWNVTYSPEYSIALWIGYDRTTREHYLTSAIGGKARKAIMKEVGTRIYSEGYKFERPSGVIEVEIEKDTIPVKLASEFTPEDMRTTEIFKEGTEPTEVSTRYSKLDTPTNGNYTFDGTTLKLSWNKIATPDAINSTSLQEYFNTYFEEYANKYYEERVKYNDTYIGTLGYNIYRKNSDGTLTFVGRSEGTSFTTNTVSTDTTAYVIKSAYSKFSANMSDGLEIQINPNIDSNITDIVDPTTPDNPDTPAPEPSTPDVPKVDENDLG